MDGSDVDLHYATADRVLSEKGKIFGVINRSSAKVSKAVWLAFIPPADTDMLCAGKWLAQTSDRADSDEGTH